MIEAPGRNGGWEVFVDRLRTIKGLKEGALDAFNQSNTVWV